MPRYNGREWWSWLRRFSVNNRCTVVKVLYLSDRITDWQLWDVLSHHQSPIPFAQARQVYRDLGFKPHVGYPLHKEERSCTS
jgi:hypothetical protein